LTKPCFFDIPQLVLENPQISSRKEAGILEMGVFKMNLYKEEGQ